MPAPTFFPPPPARLVGRAAELRALATRIRSGQVTRLALIGGGGSGKSLLACALGHRLRRDFPGGVHWLRIGAWGASTLREMLARRLSTQPAPETLTAHLRARGPTFIVLDNHEDDRATARFLETLRGCPVVWLITARRCLLSGVDIYPVVPPLSTTRQSAFPRVASLTTLLRWHPLALDIAESLVASGAVTAAGLRRFLLEGGVERVAPRRNEDDVLEVRLLVDWAWGRLHRGARRMLAALAHSEGDEIDGTSLATLAGVRDTRPLRQLRAWHLVQEPLAGRFALHAVVREAIVTRTRYPAARYFRHYMRLLEKHPERIQLEQTHLYAAMDHANRTGALADVLRIERLVSALSP